MSGEAGNLIAWDSCVFLAWFKQETDKPLGDIELFLTDIAKGRFVLLVSTVCCAEVLDEAGVSDAGTKFRGFVRRNNVIPANVDMRVAELAAEFRQRLTAAVNRQELKKGLKAPDALIAATAVIYHADVLHTFDPDLLDLSRSEYLDGLLIEPPYHSDPQKPLGLSG